MKRGECQREEEGEIDEEQNGKQVSETMTQKTDKQAGRLRRSQPIDTAWLMYLCFYAYGCVCACVYANASGEIILCGLLYPRSVGTSLGFHRYRSPGTRTDRQADGETADHEQLSAEVLKPARSQWETYWSQVFSKFLHFFRFWPGKHPPEH